MRRREFIVALGSALVARPLQAFAKPSAMPLVGYLAACTPELEASHAAAFRAGLSETGYIEGRNVKVEYLLSYNSGSSLENAADLVRRGASVLVSSSLNGARAAKASTATIPI